VTTVACHITSAKTANVQAEMPRNFRKTRVILTEGALVEISWVTRTTYPR